MAQITNVQVSWGECAPLEGVSISKRATALTATAAVGLAATGLIVAGTTGEQPPAATPAANVKASPETTTQPPKPKDVQEKAIVAVIDRFHRAVDKGDGKKACALLTKALQGVYATNPGASDCASGIEFTSKQLGDARMASMELAPADVRVKGKEAIVSHKLIAKRNGTKASQTDSYNMIRVGSAWKIDYVG